MPDGRDRTTEFQTTLKTFANKRSEFDRPSQAPINHRQQLRSDIKQRNIFMQNAKTIGDTLSQTFLKLEQLILIVKQSSLFNGRSLEIQDISNLNQQISQLQHYIQNTSQFKSENSQTHSNSVVFVLKSKLTTISNDFEQLLETRTRNLKDQKSRGEIFSSNNAASSLTIVPTVTTQGDHSDRRKRRLKRPETTIKRRITALNFSVFRRRSSALFRDDHRTENGDDAIVNMSSEGTFPSSIT